MGEPANKKLRDTLKLDISQKILYTPVIPLPKSRS